ncbi:MAG: 5'/3'-nucleotidase SurE [Lachnospiraceae bacterium]|nr:5'/3'-nucleotidase SurE [Lachnospiraceae bacterium]
MRILLTNDDGIYAHGLERLAKAVLKYGEVWVVAPAEERSAASHSVTLRHPLDVYPITDYPIEGVKAYSCSGTPVDCVRVGSLSVMPEKPDVVISGINNGFNMASDLQYSATVGAAFEGTFQEYHAIAISEAFDGPHEVTDHYLPEILDRILYEQLPPGHIHNVNFPECSISECKGILYNRKVSRGMFFKDRYNEIEKLENGGIRYMIEGIKTPVAEEETDFKALLDHYVSVGTVNNIGY